MINNDWMTDSDQVIKPSSNETQEAVRWLPSGAKQLLMRMGVDDYLDRQPPVIVAWMEEHDLVRTPTKGEHAGHKMLSPLGKKVHKVMERKMKGQDGT